MTKLEPRIATVILLLGVASARAASVNPATQPQISPAMTAAERANLDTVLEWWRIVLQGGRLERTVQYQAEDYIQHTPNLPTGRAAFIDFFQNVLGRRPAETIPAWLDPTPVVAGAKGDFVFLIFEHEAADPREPSRTYFHNSFELLRIEDGKIQEHWDSYKRVPRPAGAPPLPPFEQPASQAWRGSMGTLSPLERQNLALVTIQIKDMLQYGHLELAEQVLDPGYIQHNPRVPQGRDGFVRFMSRTPERTPGEIATQWPDPPRLTLVSGPYVWMMWDRVADDPDDPSRQYTWNHFDVLRVENGLIKEHWDEAVVEPQ